MLNYQRKTIKHCKYIKGRRENGRYSNKVCRESHQIIRKRKEEPNGNSATKIITYEKNVLCGHNNRLEIAREKKTTTLEELPVKVF